MEKAFSSISGGPTWNLNDGSAVIGEVIAKADAPEPNAIQWLLLRAKSHEGLGTCPPLLHSPDGDQGRSNPENGLRSPIPVFIWNRRLSPRGRFSDDGQTLG